MNVTYTKTVRETVHLDLPDGIKREMIVDVFAHPLASDRVEVRIATSDGYEAAIHTTRALDDAADLAHAICLELGI